jgi:uncharacterized protein (DUF1778 family)
MVPVKQTTLRIKPHIRALIERLAEIEHRDITNMIEVAVLAYAKQHGVSVPGADEVKGEQS